MLEIIMDRRKVEEFFKDKSIFLKQKIRNAAITNAKKTLRRNGQTLDEIPFERYKLMIAEEEDLIKNKILKTGGVGIFLFGFMPWF